MSRICPMSFFCEAQVGMYFRRKIYKIMKTNYVLIALLACGFYSCSGDSSESNENEGVEEVAVINEIGVSFFSNNQFSSVTRRGVTLVDTCMSVDDGILRLKSNSEVFTIKVTDFTNIDEYLESFESGGDAVLSKEKINVSDEMQALHYVAASGFEGAICTILNAAGNVCAIDCSKYNLEQYDELLASISKNGAADFPNSGLSFNSDSDEYIASCSRKKWILDCSSSELSIYLLKGYPYFDEMSIKEYAAEEEYVIVDTFSFENGARGFRYTIEEYYGFEAGFENESGSVHCSQEGQDDFKLSDENYEDLKFFFENMK